MPAGADDDKSDIASSSRSGNGPAIDLERLKCSLIELSGFGGDPSGRSVTRPSFSDADMQARTWLLRRMSDLGMAARIDAAGNVIGRWEVGSGPAVMIGSHLDSVPMGGIFDGSLGVVAGLECVHSLMEQGVEPGSPIEVVATSEEEGRFGGMLGAQAMVGEVSADWLEQARDDTGVKLTDAMRAQGLDPQVLQSARRDPGSIKAFLELHVEQGPVLDRLGKPVGIVEGISGVFNWTVRFSGTANHAGTTPMDMRRDAFRGLVDFAREIPDLLDRHGTEASRLTVGKVDLRPGFPHTVPGEAEFSLIGRDMDEPVMKALAEACRLAIETAAELNDLTVQIDRASWLAPVRCHPEIIAAFEVQATHLGLDPIRMPSGAGHDTQIMTELTKAGMIFVPSVGGISHSPEEWTDWADIEVGTNLLLRTILQLTA